MCGMISVVEEGVLKPWRLGKEKRLEIFSSLEGKSLRNWGNLGKKASKASPMDSDSGNLFLLEGFSLVFIGSWKKEGERRVGGAKVSSGEIFWE